MQNDRSDTYWLNLIKTGQDDAVRVLWERYFRRLLGLARKQLHGAPKRIADEQDVALSAFHSFCQGAAGKKFEKLDDRDDLWKILSVITVRKANRQIARERALKRGGGRVRGESALDHRRPTGESGQGFENYPIDPAESPEMMVSIEEQFLQLFSELPSPDLKAIALQKLEGLTNTEIAQQLGRHERSVERKLQLIRKHWSRFAEK